jgi:HAD superfamily hydrolase (TIGR01509 family)
MGAVLKAHGLDAHFDLVVCAIDVPQPKPHPDMLVKVLDHFGVTAPEMLFVGDSALDAQAAQAARVPFVAYGNLSLQAAYHITTLKALEDIIGFH